MSNVATPDVRESVSTVSEAEEDDAEIVSNPRE
jgi:hypothetical protein